jgi:hypothetical protein
MLEEKSQTIFSLDEEKEKEKNFQIFTQPKTCVSV